jgi:hypothetical protein
MSESLLFMCFDIFRQAVITCATGLCLLTPWYVVWHISEAHPAPYPIGMGVLSSGVK